LQAALKYFLFISLAINWKPDLLQAIAMEPLPK